MILVSDEWLERMAKLEENSDVSAGIPCDCPCHDDTCTAYKILKDSIPLGKCSCCE